MYRLCVHLTYFMRDKQAKTWDEAKLSKHTWTWKKSASWKLQKKNHNNHILITDYGQEKYDYDLIMIIAAE